MAGFNNPVIGGLEKLIREAIQSPNYVPGISGWTINRDGSVEFNNGIFRGTLQAGTLIAGLITESSISNSVFGDGQILNSTITDTDIVIDSSGGTLLVYAVSGQTVTTVNAVGAGVFNIPAGVTFLKVEKWGGGGGGQGSFAAGGTVAYGASGSGGEYACDTHYVVAPLSALNYVVGDGGAGGPGSTASSFATIGQNGQSTTFDNTSPAHGGLFGFGGTPRVGGSGSTDPIHFNGGGNAVSNFGDSGAGGASSGGSSSNGRPGNPAISDTVPGAGAVAVNNGGAGGAGGAVSTVGSPGVQPGGGGGGAGGLRPTTVRAGGKGGAGRLRLTYGGAITLIASVAGVAGIDQYGNSYPVGIRTNISTAAGLSGGYYEEIVASNQNIPASTTTQVGTVAAPLVAQKLISDYGSAWNLTTGVWTAPIDGVYTLVAGVRWGASVAGTREFQRFASVFNTAPFPGNMDFIPQAAVDMPTIIFTKFLTAGTVYHLEVFQATAAAKLLDGSNTLIVAYRSG